MCLRGLRVEVEALRSLNWRYYIPQELWNSQLNVTAFSEDGVWPAAASIIRVQTQIQTPKISRSRTQWIKLPPVRHMTNNITRSNKWQKSLFENMQKAFPKDKKARKSLAKIYNCNIVTTFHSITTLHIDKREEKKRRREIIRVKMWNMHKSIKDVFCHIKVMLIIIYRIMVGQRWELKRGDSRVNCVQWL